jgi:hypothetical protein
VNTEPLFEALAGAVSLKIGSIFYQASSDSINWFTPATTLVVGLVLGLIVEPLRTLLLRAKLRATFFNDEHCMRETPVDIREGAGGRIVGQSTAKVVRFRVDNETRRQAKGCVTYLLSIDRITGNTVTRLFADRIPLIWAYYSEFTPIDIPGRTGLYCDVAGSVDEANPRLDPHTVHKAVIYRNLLQPHATYRFTAIVTGDNVKPVSIRICIEWDGNWNIRNAWQDKAV